MLDISRAYGLDFQFPLNDQLVGPCLREAGEFAKAELDILNAIVTGRSGSFVDLGANIGTMSLPIAKQNPLIHVTAVEANRHLSNILSGNAALNRLPNVDVIHAAAGAEAGLVAFPTPSLDAKINFGHLALNDDDHAAVPTENVRVCTLDEIARPDTILVKMDVEGFEHQVMAGAQRLLRKREASWVFEWNRDGQSAAIIQMFYDAGYDPYWLYAPFVSPSAAKKSRTASLAGDTNVLAIPRTLAGPPVEMQKIKKAEEERPNRIEAYPYLLAYGFT